MLLVVGSAGEKPPAGVRESWLFVFLPSDYAPGEARCGHPNHTALQRARNRSIPRQVDSFKFKNAYIHLSLIHI